MSHKIKRFNNRIEWLNNRVIGGSSASAILGLNPYKSNVDLWESLVNKKEIVDDEKNEIQEYGSNAEKYIRELFKLEHPQYEVIDPVENDIELMVHNEYDFITGTLDGVLIEKETGKKGILEIKTQYATNSRELAKWENGNIPDNYYTQILHYLLIDEEFEFVVIKCRQRTLNNKIYEIEYRLERNNLLQDINTLLQKELEFWQYVVEHKRPPLIINI